MDRTKVVFHPIAESRLLMEYIKVVDHGSQGPSAMIIRSRASIPAKDKIS
jgi:hypothetical protein